MIYAAWSQMPISIPKHHRGDNSAASATATRAVNFNLIRKEAKAFVQLHGLEKPQSKEDWAILFREMGRFLATKTFMTNCPIGHEGLCGQETPHLFEEDGPVFLALGLLQSMELDKGFGVFPDEVEVHRPGRRSRCR